ncbi:MAG: nitrate reductase subunit alpha, partial [Cyanobacteria bacterium NC_groundwater_1444_Ag_S-0.65um_54_12]|nr:nitrate reductase subunit alpha [Cyanobacteria bacterium NC_groundwater_1444_Ag_S-0.65um_54_12]
NGNGVQIPIARFYDELLENPVDAPPDSRRARCVEWGGQRYPSLEDALDAANILLRLAPETNGEIAYAAFQHEEERCGVPLVDLAQNSRDLRTSFFDLARQPRRTLTSPCWSGLMNEGRAYAAWSLNVERQVPWRTLTGREQCYLDHQWYLDFGEALPTYKPKLDPQHTGDIIHSDQSALRLNYLTPHGKWHIHSTFADNHRMLTLSRGCEPCWINTEDADLLNIHDNDWVEVYNDNGVVVTRAVVSSRVQRGTCMIYHSPERTLGVPRSPLRGNRRAGGHNSLTRTRINPLLLAGGYAQFTYGFNYWGPIGCNRDTWVVIRKLERLSW